jgi:hypothetical protein
MSVNRPLPPRPLPRWLVPVVSVVLAFHVFAVLMLVLSPISGPWPAPPPYGNTTFLGPAFARQAASITTRYYLQPMQMTHNYHFLGNRPDLTQIVFEARVKDAQGRLIDSVRFPSPRDNAWLRQRHVLMAAQLGDDEPVQPPGAEPISGPGTRMPTRKIWESAGPSKSTLKDVEVHLLPKNMPVYKPREWTLLVARSYARYLMHKYDGASVELTRESRPPVPPALMFLEQAPPGTFDTLVSTFEEFHREK